MSNNFIEHRHFFSAQAAGTGLLPTPLDTANGAATLESVTVYLSAVAGGPTAVTLDLDITDGVTTKAAISGQSLGTAAGTVRLAPTDADKQAGNNVAPVKASAFWRYTLDFNFTGGTTPTLTGTVVARWRV